MYITPAYVYTIIMAYHKSAANIKITGIIYFGEHMGPLVRDSSLALVFEENICKQQLIGMFC